MKGHLCYSSFNWNTRIAVDLLWKICVPKLFFIKVNTTFRLLRTKITIDLLFPCKEIIWPHFLRMQLTLLVTGKNEYFVFCRLLTANLHGFLSVINADKKQIHQK
jgi:hypothetical protein